LRQAHGAEYAFQTDERMISGRGAPFEEVFPILTLHHDGVSAVCRFADFAKVSLKLGERYFHLIRLSD